MIASHYFLLVPCFREIFQAGPSKDRSTSIWLSLVALPRVISRERIRYRTMRPRSTASVWLSKSGELMPGGGAAQVGDSTPLRATGQKVGPSARSTEGDGSQSKVY